MILVMLILVIILISFVSAEVRINEVELNPDGIDSGNEWVELYSDEEINLTGWVLFDASNDSMELDITINGYYILESIPFNLRNSNENLSLYNYTNLISEFPTLNDPNNDNKTWQYCNGDWNFTYMTKGVENNCNLADTTPPDDNSDSGEIYLEAEWDEEEIINTDEFEIKVKAFNLEDEYYNIKIWIKFEDNDTIISQRYNEDSEEWSSGNYYVDEFFKGPDDKTKRIDLRIKDDYDEHYGDYFDICYKLEDVVDSEECDSIEILEKEEEEVVEEPDYEVGTVVQSQDASPVTGKVIQLGAEPNEEDSAEAEGLKEPDNILYQSKTELMKKYAIYVFAFFCVGLSALLVFEKLK